MPRKKPTERNFNPAVPLALPNRELFAQAVASGVPVTGNKTTRSHLRHDPQVDARVTWLLADRIRADTAVRHRREKPLADLRERVVRELERVAFADFRNVVQWERRPVVDAEGNVVRFEDAMVPTPSRLLSADAAAAVRGVTSKSGTLRIELADKLQALDKLGRMLGLFQDVAPAANVTVNQLNLNNGPETALEAARRLAFALAKAQYAAIAPRPSAVIEIEKAE
jgi:hypothetical protein